MADQRPMPIAIVGMSCRLPGDVSTPGDFYRMLCRKRSGWSGIPSTRFHAAAYHHPNPDKKGCFNSLGGYFIRDDISMFDAAFFDVTKKEAECMDPALRLLMECAYEAVENAGAPKESLSGKRVGVFIGGNYGEHRVGNLRDLDYIPSFDATGNQAAFLAGRIAYYFNLRGPTLTVDTACSSSMHALHLAVQSIRAGESEQAIVGASHLITQPDIWVSMGKLRLFSDGGKSYPFDHRAKSGYARGEGAVCLLLKPLAQAQADNDHIFSVITHTGINHNGRTVGIVAPSPEEQEELLRKVFAEAKIDPRDVGFFEAHGTGTKKGDPIEARAIHEAVGKCFTREDPLHIGSAKANVGHLECASGIVSVIKGALMLYYGFILPNADFERPNEAIPFGDWGMHVATKQKPWPANRKYVCVNNFGFSGSNATCVLSAAPQVRGLEVASRSGYSPLRLFVLSANDEAAMRNSVKKLGVWIEQHAELYQTTLPRNLAYTLCQRRSHLPWRVAVVASSCTELATQLNSHQGAPARAPHWPPRLAFVFTGQGAQWFAMGRELLRSYPVFFNAISRADAALRDLGASFSVLEELNRDKETSRVSQSHLSQPLCSAVQLALTDLLASFGVWPSAVTGHSSGEIAAAYAAGAMTFESAMAAAYYRGQALVELKTRHPHLRGAMMAVGVGAEEVESTLRALNDSGEFQTVVACENSPSSTTLSGDEAAIDRLAAKFQGEGIFNRKLVVDVAYHSPHMQLVAESYLACVSHIRPLAVMGSHSVEFFSSLRGCRVDQAELGPQYWVDNLTQAVRFATALRRLCTEHRPDILVEVGPHAALQGPILQTLKSMGREAASISYLPTLVRNQDATRTCLESAARLFLRGYPLDFLGINHNREEHEKPELIPTLYTYPWSRQQYWYESRLTQQHRLKPFARHDLLGTLADWSNHLEPTWRNVIRTDDMPWLKEYRARNRIVFPVACFISMVVEAAGQKAVMDNSESEPERFEIRDLRVAEQLFLDEGREVEMCLSLRPARAGSHDFRIHTYEEGRGWLAHCTGAVAAVPETEKRRPAVSAEVSSKGAWAGRLRRWVARPRVYGARELETVAHARAGKKYYRKLASHGMTYPRSFRSLVRVAATGPSGTGVAAQGLVPETAGDMPLQHETAYEIHPSVIDAMFQASLPAVGSRRAQVALLPTAIRHMTLRSCSETPKGAHFFVHAVPETTSRGFAVELFSAASSAGAAISLSGLEFDAVRFSPRKTPAPRKLCFKIKWQEVESARSTTPLRDIQLPKSGAGVVIIVESGAGVDHPLAASVASIIHEKTGIHPRIHPLEAVDDWADNYFLVLSEVKTELLRCVDETGFERIKKLLTQAPGVLWVTSRATRLPTRPGANLALGLIRTVRSERGMLAATLDLDSEFRAEGTSRAELIWEAFGSSVLSGSKGIEADMEFAEIGGKLFVPRIVPHDELNKRVHRAVAPSAPYQQNFHQAGRRLRLSLREDPMSLDELYFEDAPNMPLGDREVEISVAASLLSQDDLATARLAKANEPISRSCSGTVTRVGHRVRNVRVGDRVCALAMGPLGTHARARATGVVPVPEEVDLVGAAIIPGAFAAAHYALYRVARLRRGERVLVQVAGPVALAALAVARLQGAKPYALIQDCEQRKAAVAAGLDSGDIFDARSIYVQRHVHAATGGRGMDVVLVLSGNDNTAASECLAGFGRLVEIRTSSSHARTKAHLGANATVTSIDMLRALSPRSETMEWTLKTIMAHIGIGALAPTAKMHVVPISRLHQGLQSVADGAVYPVVVVNGTEERVKAVHRVSNRIFQSNRTHLIVGGAGGLGRAMARYMIERGARYIVLLSRSGGNKEAVRQLQRQLRRFRARITVMRCDASDLRQVRRAIEECRRGHPPICGVIHAAMVLRDMLLENMTHHDYQEVLRPKVDGAWNLHKVLAANRTRLDYFVVLSSAAGILGSRGQAAYAAASTFLDSFVQFRVRNGLPGTALDLTAVTGAGYVAENAERREAIARNFGNELISKVEVLALLSAAVQGACGPQCLAGLGLRLDSNGQWPYYASDARFAILKAMCLAAAEREGRVPRPTVSPGDAFRAAKSDEEAVQTAAEGIVQKLSEVLTISAEDLDVARNITSFGLDSLTAIDLRNWIAKEFRANLQILELLSSGTILDLAVLIVQKARSASS